MPNENAGDVKQRKKLVQTMTKDERSRKAHRMYLKGNSCRKIAKKLGVHYVTAWRYVMRGNEIYNERFAVNTKDYIKLNLRRLESLIDPHWKEALNGDIESGKEVRDSIREQNRLLGSDKPIIEIRAEMKVTEEVREMMDHLEKELEPQEYAHVVQALSNIDGSAAPIGQRPSIDQSTSKK